jgi:nucleoside phosphorylase
LAAVIREGLAVDIDDRFPKCRPTAIGPIAQLRIMSSELSALLSAVKPRERTNRYVILSSLYSVGAHKEPATATQVRDALLLHLGKDTPDHIPLYLRRYKGSARPVAKGPPIQWELTAKGVDELRSLSGMPLLDGSKAAYESDIGVICALEDPEFSAVMDAFGGKKNWVDAGSTRFTHLYRSTELKTKAGKKLKIIGTTASSMGLTAAAIVTTQLLLQFRPRIVVMVGIAAGTRAGNKQFGDVLVADPSVDYNSGKVVSSKGIREFLPDPYPIGINPRLRSLLLRYGLGHPTFAAIRSRWSGKAPGGKNRLFLGPVGAADQVIDDETRVVEIQKNWRKLIGVEMETYAVYRACHEAPEPKPRFVSFKAVCDFAAEKGDSWQAFAAFMAAQFASEFLTTEWEVLWPSLQEEKI